MLDISNTARAPNASAALRAAPQASAGAGSAAAVPAEAKASAAPTPLARPDIKVDTEGNQRRLQQAISDLNASMKDGGRGLNFQVDPSLGRPVVTVTNQETGEVIRQIPNEVVVRMAHSIDNAKGYLLNAQV